MENKNREHRNKEDNNFFKPSPNIQEGEDNNLILSQMFADEIKQARDKNSLKTILESIGVDSI